MKLNYETCLVGKKVVLVPYRPQHVPKYHEWMKDPGLLEATGSEPLTYEEEVAMQKTWWEDPAKCTFIVHAAERWHMDGDDCHILDNLDGMVGDVNLFLSEIEEESQREELEGTEETKQSRVQAEIDIMIADGRFRRKGLGQCAICMMIMYGAENLNIERFFCKINEDNVASLELFKSIGFLQCDYAACFKQVELELVKTQDDIKRSLALHGSYVPVNCPIPGDEQLPSL